MGAKILKGSIFAFFFMGANLHAMQSPGEAFAQHALEILKSDDYNPEKIDALFVGSPDVFVAAFKSYFLAHPDVVNNYMCLEEFWRSSRIINSGGLRAISECDFYQACRFDSYRLKKDLFGDSIASDRLHYFYAAVDRLSLAIQLLEQRAADQRNLARAANRPEALIIIPSDVVGRGVGITQQPADDDSDSLEYGPDWYGI
jgi:hypothetical protein